MRRLGLVGCVLIASASLHAQAPGTCQDVRDIVSYIQQPHKHLPETYCDRRETVCRKAITCLKDYYEFAIQKSAVPEQTQWRIADIAGNLITFLVSNGPPAAVRDAQMRNANPSRDYVTLVSELKNPTQNECTGLLNVASEYASIAVDLSISLKVRNPAAQIEGTLGNPRNPCASYIRNFWEVEKNMLAIYAQNSSPGVGGARPTLASAQAH